jgi:hypothetical protein
MLTKKQAYAMCQQEANRAGAIMALINLNNFGRPLYVCRLWNDAYAGKPDLVDKFYPLSAADLAARAASIPGSREGGQ